MTEIHETAMIHPQALLDIGVKIGPYVIIEEDVEIGEGTTVEAYSIIRSGTRIGKFCKIGPFAALGGDPQDVNYKGYKTYLEIGDYNIIREYVSIHRASKEGEATTVGDKNFLMAYVHIGHDCRIGNEVILTSFAGISGHVSIDDKAVIGGQVGIHQFVRIGTLAMISGLSGVGKDVPPYTIAAGRPAKIVGLNVVGMRRKEIPSEARRAISNAFKLLYRSNLNVSQALERIQKEINPFKEVLEFVNFIKNSKRGICGFKRESDE